MPLLRFILEIMALLGHNHFNLSGLMALRGIAHLTFQQHLIPHPENRIFFGLWEIPNLRLR